MSCTIILKVFLVLLIISSVHCGFWNIFEYLIQNNQGPFGSGDSEEDSLKDVDGHDGSNRCSQLAGCTTALPSLGCFGPSGAKICLEKCLHTKEVHHHNVMRTDFYDVDFEHLNSCTDDNNGDECAMKYIKTMLDEMILKDDEIALTVQGAPFKEQNMPENIVYHEHYHKTFCGNDCWDILKDLCDQPHLGRIRDWCLTALNFIEHDVENLKGPGSMILFLATRITIGGHPVDKTIKCNGWRCQWPIPSNTATAEEVAVMVASAAMSVFLSGHWWRNIDTTKYPNFKDFGFAVQHSLWLAIYDGRLRLTLQPRRHNNELIPGNTVLCGGEKGKKISDNYEGSTGTVYATLCSLFYYTSSQEVLGQRKLRYQPEIHVPNYQKCVERKSGMVFIRPGDWFPKKLGHSSIGSSNLQLGMSFYDEKNSNLTTIEFSVTNGVSMYPPTIGVSMLQMETTRCTVAQANGPNLYNLFHRPGLRGIGGICNWVPVW